MHEPTAHRTDRRLRKRENTRARLVAAAADVVIAKGLAAARIDDVVSRAGFTRGAFYSNYSSLDEVLTEAIVERSQDLLATIQDAVDALPAEPSLEDLITVLDELRPQALALNIISREYELHLMRHPEAPEVPVPAQAGFSDTLTGLVDAVLHRMGRRPRIAAQDLTNTLSLFYLDAITQEAIGLHRSAEHATDPRSYLRRVVDTIITGLSVPVDDAQPPATLQEPVAPPAQRPRTQEQDTSS